MKHEIYPAILSKKILEKWVFREIVGMKAGMENRRHSFCMLAVSGLQRACCNSSWGSHVTAVHLSPVSDFSKLPPTRTSSASPMCGHHHHPILHIRSDACIRPPPPPGGGRSSSPLEPNIVEQDGYLEVASYTPHTPQAFRGRGYLPGASIY